MPGLIVLGQYGRQRWEAGDLSSPPAPPGVADGPRATCPACWPRPARPTGTWTEDKGDALAVHTRRAADPERALELLREPLAELAGRTGLRGASRAGW